MQVQNVADVSQPSSTSAGGGGSGGRMLRLKLTDGKASCTAVEVHPVAQLHPDMVPGSKVLLEDAPIRTGIVLLQPGSVKVGRITVLP